MKEMILFLGYCNDPSHPFAKTETGFFTYDKFEGMDQYRYMGFKKHNAEVLSKLGTSALQGDFTFEYNTDLPIDSMIMPIVEMDIAQKQVMR